MRTSTILSILLLSLAVSPNRSPDIAFRSLMIDGGASETAAVSLAPLSIRRERSGMSGERVGDGDSNRAMKARVVARIRV